MSTYGWKSHNLMHRAHTLCCSVSSRFLCPVSEHRTVHLSVASDLLSLVCSCNRVELDSIQALLFDWYPWMTFKSRIVNWVFVRKLDLSLNSTYPFFDMQRAKVRVLWDYFSSLTYSLQCDWPKSSKLPFNAFL